MMIRGDVPEKPKTPNALKELEYLKKDKQLLRQQHPVASRFALVISLLCGLLSTVYIIALVGGFFMAYAAGLNYISIGISYLLAGKFFASAPPMSSTDISIGTIFLAICLGGLILAILAIPVTNLYHKYYVD